MFYVFIMYCIQWSSRKSLIQLSLSLFSYLPKKNSLCHLSFICTQSAAPSSPASQRAPEQEDRQRTRVGGNRSSWNFLVFRFFLGDLSNLAAIASLVQKYCKRLNLKECWLDSGHCEGDRLDIVGCQSVAPEIVTKCNWADWLHQKMIKLSKSYLANSTSLTLSAFLCWMKARPWQGLDGRQRLIFNYVKTVNLEHLYGDRRNMWGLSWAT